MERLTAGALRHPPTTILLALMLTALAFFGLTRLSFDDGMRAAFQSNSDDYALFENTRNAFTSPESDILIVFEAEDFADPVALEAVRSFVLEVQFIDGIDHVMSMFSLRRIDAAGTGTRPLFPDELENTGALERLLDNGRSHPLGGDRFLSADHRRMLVAVALEASIVDIPTARVVREGIDETARETIDGTGVRYSLTGMLPVREAIISGLLKDQVTLNFLGAVAGFLMCIVVFRSIPLALLTGLPAVAALIWVLGTLGLTGVSVNTVTNALPVLILVLAFADSMHLSFELCRQIESGVDPDEALKTTFRNIGPACVLTSITTAVAFAALLLSSSALVRSLGQGGTMAVMISLAAVLIVHPLLFKLGFRIGLLKATRITAPRFFAETGRAGSGVMRFVSARPFIVAGTGIVALIVSTAGYATIEPVYSFFENIERSDTAVQTLDTVEGSTGPVLSIDVPLAMPASGVGVLDAADLARLGAVHEAVREAAPGSAVTSLWNIARWLAPQDPASAAPTLQRLLNDMQDGMRARFVSHDGTLAILRVFAHDEGSRAVRAAAERIEQAASIAAGENLRATGLLTVSARVSAEMISHLNISFLAAVAASGVLMMVWFRSVSYGLIGLIPNVIPIAMVGAWLALSGRGLQFTSALALTIAFGIAVDDTVHYFNRLRLEAPKGDPLNPQAIRNALIRVAPVLVATTLVLCIGMASTLASQMPMIRYFGELAMSVFVIALLADVVILPACLLSLGKFLKRWNSTP